MITDGIYTDKFGVIVNMAVLRLNHEIYRF